MTALAACAAPVVRAASPQAPGQGLTPQMMAYFANALGQHAPDHRGSTDFLPLPNGTLDPARNVYVGHEDVTLAPNRGFFLPIFVWSGETYNNGTPDDDPSFPTDATFTGARVLLTMDGTTILDSTVDDLQKNFVPATYYPHPIWYAEPTSYGSVAMIWVKGIGTQQGPLAPGTHQLSLLITSPWILSFAGFNGWANTWTITVGE